MTSPRFLFDVRMCSDVIYFVVILFIVPNVVCLAYNEEDLAGKVGIGTGTHDFGAYKAIEPITSMSITSIYCKHQSVVTIWLTVRRPTKTWGPGTRAEPAMKLPPTSCSMYEPQYRTFFQPQIDIRAAS